MGSEMCIRDRLEWDAGLAEDAQKWADHLANDVGYMVHAQNTGEGENLFWSKGSHIANCEDAVQAWYVNPTKTKTVTLERAQSRG